jgi:hypothetical protein
MLIFECPHCEGTIVVEATNCCIFRHGQYKTGEQVSPHAPKEKCDRLVALGEVFGCCKPFRLLLEEGHWVIEKCGYL